MSNSVFPDLALLDIAIERATIFQTSVQTEASTRELRVAMNAAPRYRYLLKYNGLRQDGSVDEFQTLLAFFNQHRGSWDDFLFGDPKSDTVTNAVIGFRDGASWNYPLVDEMGGPVAKALSYTVTANGGTAPTVTTLHADPASVDISPTGVDDATFRWSGQFQRRVRFASDTQPAVRLVNRIWTAQVELISVV